MNKPMGDVRDAGWRDALNELVMHPWVWPVCGVTVSVFAAILVSEIVAWRLDLASLPALPDISAPAAAAAPQPVRISSGGFVPQAAPVPVALSPTPSAASAQKSSLPIELIGTFVASDGPKAAAKSVAIVQVTSGSREVNVLRIGEKWQGLELLEVERSRIWVKNLSTGAREFISNDQLVPTTIGVTAHARSSGPAARSGNEIVVSRAQVNRAIDNNTNVIFSWVSVEPYAVAGQVQGFRLNNIKPRGKPFFNLLGFMEGDIVKRVNGVKMDSVDKAVGLWSAIHGKDNVTFTIERQGAEKEHTIAFSP